MRTVSPGGGSKWNTVSARSSSNAISVTSSTRTGSPSSRASSRRTTPRSASTSKGDGVATLGNEVERRRGREAGRSLDDQSAAAGGDGLAGQGQVERRDQDGRIEQRVGCRPQRLVLDHAALGRVDHGALAVEREREVLSLSLLAKAIAPLFEPEADRELELARIPAGSLAVGAGREARPAHPFRQLEVPLERELRALEVCPVPKRQARRAPAIASPE